MWLAPHPHRLKIQMTLPMHSTKFPLPIALPLHPRVMRSFYFLVLTLILLLFQASLTRTFLLLLFPILLLFVPFVSFLESKKYVHDARVYAMTTTIWSLQFMRKITTMTAKQQQKRRAGPTTKKEIVFPRSLLLCAALVCYHKSAIRLTTWRKKDRRQMAVGYVAVCAPRAVAFERPTRSANC